LSPSNYVHERAMLNVVVANTPTGGQLLIVMLVLES